MPNFTATLRTSYRDVSGLVLSCTRDDIVEDVLHSGFIRGWTNKSMGLPSVPMHRLPSTPVTYAGGRAQSPIQLIAVNQPELSIGVGGIRRIRFRRAKQQYLACKFDRALPSAANPMTFAFQFEAALDATTDQAIYSDATNQIYRLKSSVASFKVGAITYVSGSAMADGVWLAGGSTSQLAVSYENAAPGTSAGDTSNQLAVNQQMYIGRSAGGDYLDGYLDSFHIWTRELSPIEKDFVWQTLSQDGVHYNALGRGAVAATVLTDATGDVGTTEIVRVRSQVTVNQHFKLATITAPLPVRVQIAASENGLVKRDANLIGGAFALDWIEYPVSGAAPSLVQDSGWSSVFDCLVQTPGHYCARVWRAHGGAVLVHFDVQVV